MKPNSIAWEEARLVIAEHWHDILTWIFFNVILAGLSIWLLMIIGSISPNAITGLDVMVLNGSVAIFAGTLCATQASIFLESPRKMSRITKPLFPGLIILIVASLAVSIPAGFKPGLIEIAPRAMHWWSLVLVVLSVAVCLLLYLLRLISEGPTFKKIQEARRKRMEKAASNNSSVGSVKI